MSSITGVEGHHQLFDPDGRFMDIACFGYPIDARLRKDGTYAIVVSENDNAKTLQYRLGLQCIAGGPGGCPVTPIPEVSGCVSLVLLEALAGVL